MHICFFGSYDRDYPRNKILLDGLKQNGVEVFHCNSHYRFFIPRYFSFIKQFVSIFCKVDVIFVAYRGHLDVFCAFLLAKIFRKKLIFDIFYSIYDTYVFDRKAVKEKSLKARLYFWLDQINCLMADYVIVYTNAMKTFLASTFSIPIEKLVVLYIGGNNKVFKPFKTIKDQDKVIVEFHGWFTRMQGAEYFIQAAKELENIKKLEFWLIGDTVNYWYPFEVLKELKPANLTYFQSMNEKKLAKKVSFADISVGHLANTKKARCTISHKMYHALSCKNALIAGNYPAVKELLDDGKTCVLVNSEDSKDLARKILILVQNKNIREKLAKNGYLLHKKRLTNKIIGKRFKDVLQNYLE